MSRVFYYGSAVPPRDWLIWAALIWERVQLDGGLEDTLRRWPEYTGSNPDATLLLQLMAETDVCTSEPPGADPACLSSEDQSGWSAHWRKATAALDEIIAHEPEEVSKGKRYFVTAEEMLSIHTLMGKVKFPPRFKAASPHVDLFCEDQAPVIASEVVLGGQLKTGNLSTGQNRQFLPADRDR